MVDSGKFTRRTFLGALAGGAAAAPEHGAGMTARAVKASGAREGNGEGLRGSRMHAAGQGILGDIMPPKRPTAPWTAREKRLSIPRSVIKSLERSATVAGRGPSRKSRLTGQVRGGSTVTGKAGPGL